MSDTTQDIPEDEIFAGEYALGVLDTDERRQAETRIESDSAFAAMVWRWTDYLAPFLSEIAAVAPSPAVRERVMATLFGGDDQISEQRGLWHSLAFWRGASIALGALAVIFLAVMISRPPSRTTVETPMLIASLAPPAVEGILSVRIDPATGLAMIDVDNLAVEDLYTELWVIPADGTPRSLGVFPANGGTISLSEQILEYLEAGVALAVSLEELPTGSATGLPSERVIAIGQVRSY
ncbi:anti-sigma factor [Aquisalinus flavus]|uniref:Regulator of SigK n=1 Tax=Aquisalinus flavus TaxID=1526572 RepID=A0A8J2Y7S7_9PROT|nr:anti-sigma factor [Aquisalinus flavus]MBD0428009.1 anti-sigma factor [Aquisalinus flavus]UNE47761.1 hypothetical protein FF099_06690 [Aquisalinus flavus]GGD05714.1 anti-sigma K factor RskA [Aquisalinus flavus]